jgi:capsid portal protein
LKKKHESCRVNDNIFPKDFERGGNAYVEKFENQLQTIVGIWAALGHIFRVHRDNLAAHGIYQGYHFVYGQQRRSVDAGGA